ncbi:hypothetical protein O3M35_008297 [Rhynocoris fuscipes]|uniref:SEFIR domain-containing protein n=1 Tax=Rhynocoris fuscipes TaxID=488301 RepID=A0AAW1D6F9_9HEMI
MMVSTIFYICILLFLHLNLVYLMASKCNDEYDDYDYNVNNFCLVNESEVCRSSVDESCSNWCLSNDWMKWSIIDYNSGTVNFSLIQAPSDCCYTSYVIKLYVYDEEFCQENKASCLHSTSLFRQADCSSNCTVLYCDNCERLEFTLKYVFTSKYKLDITPFNFGNQMNSCKSGEVFIKTGYKKTLIGNNPLDITPLIYKKGDLFVRVNNGGGILSADQLVFILKQTYRKGCGEGGCRDRISIFQQTGEYHNECCYRGYGEPRDCNCKWSNNSLACFFPKIPPGNYCIHLELSDLRCATNTLWTNSTHSCSWYVPYYISEPPNLSYQPSKIKVDQYYPLLWILIALLIIIIIGSVILCIYFKAYTQKIYRHYIPRYSTCSVPELSPLNKPKILLLYPRDCEHFMNIMRDFRSLLQELLHAQVYDMWDEENWDNVNEIGHQWAIKYIIDRNIKVIIVASKCSRIFEDALIHSKTVGYKCLPDSFDQIFLYSFKECVTIANCSRDNYKRFFVVRWDEPGCEENRFISITPCTVYTLPQHLKDLTLEIHNMDPGEVILNPKEISKIQKLYVSLAELQKFKLNNPNYLTEFLDVK